MPVNPKYIGCWPRQSPHWLNLLLSKPSLGFNRASSYATAMQLPFLLPGSQEARRTASHDIGCVPLRQCAVIMSAQCSVTGVMGKKRKNK